MRSFTIGGVTDTLRGWSHRTGISYINLYKRIVIRRMPPAEAIANPHHLLRKRITIDGVTDSYNGWARRMNMGRKGGDLISERIKAGWPIREAVGIDSHTPKTPKLLTFNGKTLSHVGWARHLGIQEGTFQARFYMWRDGKIKYAEMFRKELGNTERGKMERLRKVGAIYKWRGREYTMSDLCRIKGCKSTWIHTQLHNGYTIKQIMEDLEPVRDTKEIATRSAASFRRNRLKRTLANFGIAT